MTKTKDKYKEKVCPSCVNYNYKRQGELCANFIEVDGMVACKNYRNWRDCMKKSCRACGMCEDKE